MFSLSYTSRYSYSVLSLHSRQLLHLSRDFDKSESRTEREHNICSCIFVINLLVEENNIVNISLSFSPSLVLSFSLTSPAPPPPFLSRVKSLHYILYPSSTNADENRWKIRLFVPPWHESRAEISTRAFAQIWCGAVVTHLRQNYNNTHALAASRIRVHKFITINPVGSRARALSTRKNHSDKIKRDYFRN